jgi:hypothetical protein
MRSDVHEVVDLASLFCLSRSPNVTKGARMKLRVYVRIGAGNKFWDEINISQEELEVWSPEERERAKEEMAFDILMTMIDWGWEEAE